VGVICLQCLFWSFCTPCILSVDHHWKTVNCIVRICLSLMMWLMNWLHQQTTYISRSVHHNPILHYRQLSSWHQSLQPSTAVTTAVKRQVSTVLPCNLTRFNPWPICVAYLSTQCLLCSELTTHSAKRDVKQRRKRACQDFTFYSKSSKSQRSELTVLSHSAQKGS